MFKRIVSLMLIFIIVSTLMCSVAYAAVFTKSCTITPMFEKSNYEVYINLVVSKPYNANLLYLAVYNKNGRMIDMLAPTDALPRMKLYIKPEEYPATVKAFVWSASKTAIPFCESYTFPELKSANQVIIEQLAGFVAVLSDAYLSSIPDESSFMYKLTKILDDIHLDIIEDAKNNELVIDKNYLMNEYPDAYSSIREIALELKNSGNIDDLISEVSTTINGNKEYEQLALTLFTLLGVYDYF